MASLTDKMPAKDFNAIFKNDELAKEISQLIEKANSTKKNNNKTEYRYTKEELIAISKNPICKVPKDVFNARLAKSNLSDNIIFSLQRKDSLDKSQNISNSQENVNSDFFDENGQNYNRYKNNMRNLKNRENFDGYRENINQRFDREKNYRANKMFDSESAQCWRTEKNQLNNQNKREYHERYSQPRKYNERFSHKNSYNRNGNGYRDDYEEEPEWFSNGPESMNEFIDLKGFDDDENNILDNCNPELKDKQNSTDFDARKSGGFFDKSKNESFNHNLADLSSMLNMDVSKLFNSPNVSFLENKDLEDFPLNMFGDFNSSNSSSRAAKWFNQKESTSLEDSFHDTSKITNLLTVDSEKSNPILELLIKKNFSSQANLADIKIDMSKATSVAELEASYLNPAPMKKNENGSVKDSAVLSKLFSLAGQQETKSNITRDSLSNVPSPFNMPHNLMNEPLNKPLNSPNAPNSAPMYSEINQLANYNMNRMVNPSFLKGAPMLPFSYPENNMPFNVENHQRPPGPFFPPIPPELTQQFFPPNSYFPPGFMPNGPFPSQMMMNHSNPLAPPLAAQLFAQYNAMMQSSIMTQQDVAKSKSDELNITDKLLKNSKFTPTSVFRKLNDQNKTKLAASRADQNPILQTKSDVDNLNSYTKLNDSFEMNQDHRSMPVNDNVRVSNTIPHPLSNYNQLTIDKNSTDMTLLLQQLNLSRMTNQSAFSEMKPNTISLNPNDIFSAMKKTEHNVANIDLPPLPMKNALKLEDLENF